MIKQSLFNAFCFVGLLFSISCVSGQQQKGQEFINSKVYPAVACSTDTSLTYTLFLPPGYEKGKPCPILVLFDPGGDGMLPVTKFSQQAAKNNFILAGSNNSRNGMAIEATTAIYRKMILDLNSRFSLQKSAVYVGGFSGGSRVAGAIAISEAGVAGVVGCGAGLPAVNSKPANNFSYLAVVGFKDFNYTELMQLNESLEHAGYKHHLLVFDGIHQWPADEILTDIFSWLRFDAMRNQSLPADRNEINTFIEKNDSLAEKMAAEGNLIKSYEVYLKMMHFLQGLVDTDPLLERINMLSTDKQLVAHFEQEKTLMAKEQELQQKYLTDFQLKNLEWWKSESARLTALSNKKDKTGMNNVYRRLLGFLSLECYMFSHSAIKQGHLDAAERYIVIYQLVDPTNAEHRYLAAKIAATNHKTDELFTTLKQAFELGFKDMKRLNSDPDFDPYRGDTRFKNIVSGK